MSVQGLQVSLVFGAEDQAWIRREGIAVPRFWHGHGAVPVVGDVVRFGGRQFAIRARVSLLHRDANFDALARHSPLQIEATPRA